MAAVRWGTDVCDLSRVNVEKEARMCVVLCWVGWDDGWRRGEATRGAEILGTEFGL